MNCRAVLNVVRVQSAQMATVVFSDGIGTVQTAGRHRQNTLFETTVPCGTTEMSSVQNATRTSGAMMQDEVVMTVDDCDCATFNTYVTGAPEYYSDRRLAVTRFKRWLDAERLAGHYLYWGIHIDGKHIINVE